MSVWNQMNGWQRLWVAVSALSFVVLGLVYPLMTVYGGNPGQIAFREVLLKELRFGQYDL
ncbi:hypothetical protein AAII07_48405 [Microvirga sp. 0TCS3.31]